MKGNSLLIGLLAMIVSTAAYSKDEKQINNYLVHCVLSVEDDSEKFVESNTDAWAWLVDNHKKGVIENVYLSTEQEVGLNMIVKVEGGEEALEAILADNPFIVEDISTCTHRKIGVYMPLQKSE